jgi:hypothetical protein
MKLTDLRFLFTLVAVVEATYAAAGILTPPSVVATVPGWQLTADGHWLAKLMGVSLASQAMIAWVLRSKPHLGVAVALAVYQIGSAMADWVMWLLLRDQGIFEVPAGRISVLVSIPTHATIGLLLLLGVARARRASP